MRRLFSLCALLCFAVHAAPLAPLGGGQEAPPAPQFWGEETLQPTSVSPFLAGQEQSTPNAGEHLPLLPATERQRLGANLGGQGGPSSVAYQAALPRYQDDSAAPLQTQTLQTVTFPDCRMTRLSYAGGHGQRVPALLFVPKMASRARPVPALMLLPGLGTGKEVMAGTARWLVGKGYASLAIDLAQQGERAPARPASAVTAAALEQQLEDGIPQSVTDTRRGLDLLQARPDINPKRLGLVGVSLGAIVGTVTAGVDTRLRATVLVAGGGDWRIILHALSQKNATLGGRTVTGQASVDWNTLDARLAFCDPVTFAPRIAPRALLMANGARDTTIVPAAAAALYDAARAAPGSRVQREIFAQAGHIPPPELLYARVGPWLAAHL